MLAFPDRKSYENHVVKKKTDKDNVIEFAPASEGAEESPENKAAGDEVLTEDTTFETDAAEAAETDPLELLQQEKDKYYDLMLRKQAELENYRKRVFREKQEAVNLARMSVLQDVLPVVDACEKGMENRKNEDDSALLESYAEGYDLLLRQLRSFLEKNNVSAVPGIGSIFDPNVHEAVLREFSSDHEDGEILEVYRRGYTMDNLLLRAAQVTVAVHPD